MSSVSAPSIATPAPNADDWATAKAAFLAAQRAEDAYDKDVAMPACGGDLTASLPDDIAAECDRLCEARFNAEARMMDTPSPHAAAFAFKYIVAHGNGRETDGWDGMLEAEARRFAEVGDAA